MKLLFPLCNLDSTENWALILSQVVLNVEYQYCGMEDIIIGVDKTYHFITILITSNVHCSHEG